MIVANCGLGPLATTLIDLMVLAQTYGVAGIPERYDELKKLEEEIEIDRLIEETRDNEERLT